MHDFPTKRRDLLKCAGIGIATLAGLSASSASVSAHERIDRPGSPLLGPIQVPADSDAGFNYPYYLYLPETTQDEPVPMLVEPNNTGSRSDALQDHREAVENRLADGLGPQLYSNALVVPLLVPVFPRPAGELAPNGTYTHALDEDSVEIEGTPLDRVDLQLLSMVDHARELLEAFSYPVADDILLNGFSASGNFVNRFAALHPERVRSVSAGGINGTPILPLERAKGHRLDYPIGVADIEDITGEPFDAASWRDVSQLLYMGGEDENDTIPYDDAWSDRHQRVALNVYGEDMQADRMPYSERVYEDAGSDATFKIYDGIGHTPAPLRIQQDIARFHRRHAGLKQLSFSSQPQVGDTTVQFDTSIFGSGEFQIRVRSVERGDITDGPGSVTTNEQDTSAVSLSSSLQEETILGMAVPVGLSNSEDAVASVRTAVRQLPLLDVVDSPTEASPSITVSYGVDSSYETSSSLHLYVEDSSRGKTLLGTFEPGSVTEETFDLSRDTFDVAVDEGTTLSLSFVDIDSNTTLASAATVVGGGDEQPTGPDSITFSTQPTDAHDSLEIEYSIRDGYEPTKALRVQATVGDDTTVLLGPLSVGSERTETFSLEQIPLVRGSDIRIAAVDDETLATDSTVVLKDTSGAVTVRYTETPDADARSGTVQYSVSESYEVADALTLRVYDSTLYGTDPGDAFALLSPGDSGTATFTIGEDTDGTVEDPVVAVVDDVPLARTTTDNIEGTPDQRTDAITVPGGSSPAQSTDSDALLEDVNGDGDANLFDVIEYYNTRNSDAVQNNPQQFDFDSDGEAGTLFDALALYNEIR